MANELAGHLNALSQPSVVERAQLGNHKAIAQWLNAYLMPQGVYARVATDHPGCLLVLVEFNQSPDRGRLVRFICHRLCQLQSTPFSALRILARFIGTSFVLWDQTVRLSNFQPRRLPRRRRRLPAPISAPLPTSLPTSLPAAVSPPTPSTALVAVPPSLKISPATQPINLPVLAGSMAALMIAGIGSQQGWVGQLRTGGGNGSDRPAADWVQTAAGRVPVESMAIATNPADPTVTLTFASDALLRDTVASATEGYTQADVALVNLSHPLAVRPSSTVEPVSSIDRVVERGVDLVTLAPAPLAPLHPSLDAAETAEIAVVGAGQNRRQARQPKIVEVRGQRIAYLGYTDSDNTAAQLWQAGTNPAIAAQITEDIKAMRQQVDWVVVNYRWSGNLAEYPADWQVRLARHAIDQGADLVVGHHPQVLQGAEIYKGRAIAYSLGDFIYANSEAAQENYNTAVLKVALRDRQMRLEFLPVQVRQSHPAIVDGEAGKAILRYLHQASGLFEQPLPTSVILDARSQTVTPISPETIPSEAAVPVESPDSFTDYSEDYPEADSEDSSGDSSEPVDSPTWDAAADTIDPSEAAVDTWQEEGAAEEFLEPMDASEPSGDEATYVEEAGEIVDAE